MSNDIMKYGTVSDDEEVASVVPPRYLFLTSHSVSVFYLVTTSFIVFFYQPFLLRFFLFTLFTIFFSWLYSHYLSFFSPASFSPHATGEGNLRKKKCPQIGSHIMINCTPWGVHLCKKTKNRLGKFCIIKH